MSDPDPQTQQQQKPDAKPDARAQRNPRDRASAISEVVADALGVVVSPDAAAFDDESLLAKYGMQETEVTFVMRDPNSNQLIREKEACYQLMADGFYGRGLHGTFWPEGSIIVSHDIPNQHMQPLNRAAAVAYCRWLESLPQNRTFIDIGDMAEAAQILAKDSRVQHMSPQQAQRATIMVAEGLKLKREGKSVMDLRVGDINRNFAPASGGNSPPMLGAKMSDLSAIGPGMTRAATITTGTGGAAGVRRPAASPLGGLPPGQ